MDPKKEYIDPLELLTPDLDRIEPFSNRFWGPVIGGLVAFSISTGIKYMSRRPIWSGIQEHIIYVGVGAVSGKYMADFQAARLSDRDAIFRHYVELHPEDFPPQKRTKIGDLLEEWYPVR